MGRLINITILAQDILTALILLLQLFLLATSNYTDFEESPPNTWDKIWYVSEAFYLVLFSTVIALLNKVLNIVANGKLENYFISWKILAAFFLIRLVCEIIWVTTGISVNTRIMVAVLFSFALITIFCITYLPYLKKTFK